mmetsp:Transcript_9684/g.23624  ORF Transcript_9684/g.23624 Transcript_9684/m.23624 type:complete len:334 (+) Transcript_9684:588-1589(+)
MAETNPETKSEALMESSSALTSTPSIALTRKDTSIPPERARRALVYSMHPASSQTLMMTTSLLLSTVRPLPTSTLAIDALNAFMAARVKSSFDAKLSFITALTTTPLKDTYGFRSSVRRIGYSVISPASGSVTVMQSLSPSVATVACMGTPGLLSAPPFETSAISNLCMQRGMFGSFLRHVRTVPPLRPLIDMPLPMIWPTVLPSVLGTTSYCSHLFCSPPRLRREKRRIGCLSVVRPVAPELVKVRVSSVERAPKAEEMRAMAEERRSVFSGRHRRCDAAESIEINVSTLSCLLLPDLASAALSGTVVPTALLITWRVAMFFQEVASAIFET